MLGEGLEFTPAYGEKIDAVAVAGFENARHRLEAADREGTLPEDAKKLRAITGVIDHDDRRGRYYVLLHEVVADERVVETHHRWVCQAEIIALTDQINGLLG